MKLNECKKDTAFGWPFDREAACQKPSQCGAHYYEAIGFKLLNFLSNRNISIAHFWLADQRSRIFVRCRYADFKTAVIVVFDDCGFHFPSDDDAVEKISFTTFRVAHFDLDFKTEISKVEVFAPSPTNFQIENSFTWQAKDPNFSNPQFFFGRARLWDIGSSQALLGYTPQVETFCVTAKSANFEGAQLTCGLS